MRHERILSILILSDLVLAVSGLVSQAVFEPLRPSLVQVFSTGAPVFQINRTLLMVLWAAVAVSTVLAWIGLLWLLRPARPLYLGSWVGYLVLLLLRGPVISTAGSYVIQMLMALVGGMILGVIYFSELRTKLRSLRDLSL
ncbi:MAG: hypothetical protein ACJ76Y_03815 [Thermoanaerobaculia bacterium]